MGDLARILLAYPDVKVDLGGHVACADDPDACMRLSALRALSVMRELIAMAVDGFRIRATGFGSERPLADGRSREGRTINDRVEIRIVGE